MHQRVAGFFLLYLPQDDEILGYRFVLSHRPDYHLQVGYLRISQEMYEFVEFLFIQTLLDNLLHLLEAYKQTDPALHRVCGLCFTVSSY